MTSAVRRFKKPRLLDRGRVQSYRASYWTALARLGLGRPPWQLARELPKLAWIKTLPQVDVLLDTLTRGRAGPYQEANAFLLSQVVATFVEMLEGYLAKPSLTILHEDLVPPEILYGMGLQPWMAEFLGIVLPMIDPELTQRYIDAAESHGVPADLCSLPKTTVGLALEKQLPIPQAIISSNMPCDGGMGQYGLIEDALRAPTFRLDVPYDFFGQEAVDYFASELKEMILWLQKHTNARMDWDRLRHVCDQRNQAREWELELWDMLKMRPSPMAAEPIYLAHMVYAVARSGSDQSTRVFKKICQLAKKNLLAGQGALVEERHRVALWNPPTLCAIDLFAWAEQAYGAALIMDMFTFNSHPYIDTKTPETMLRGLAQVIMQGPMARHTRGPAANFFTDLFRLYEQFDLDMIWMAAHIGCKNTQALLGLLRERCRERKIPLLIIDYDLSDSRVVAPREMRQKVAQFMETVQGEAPLRTPGLWEGDPHE